MRDKERKNECAMRDDEKLIRKRDYLSTGRIYRAINGRRKVSSVRPHRSSRFASFFSPCAAAICTAHVEADFFPPSFAICCTFAAPRSETELKRAKKDPVNGDN